MKTSLKANISLNKEQEDLLDLMESSDKHLFITGKAGTGKSTLLSEFQKITDKKTVLVAPTGVAALNIGGQTIHSLFRIKPSEIVKTEELRTTKTTADLLAKIETLIIDEISMVRADLLDAMDHILKFSRKSQEPFGGVQVIMFGDLFQLPPVIRTNTTEKYFEDNYGGVYFFNAQVWQEAKLEVHELKTNIRQEEDQDFIEILNAVRDNNLDNELMVKLNQRAQHKPTNTNFITLALTNNLVNSINERELKAIDSKEYSYEAEISGKITPSEYPTEKTLKLKEFAQVMFLRNDRDKRYVNGSIGTITYLDEEGIEVEVDGETINVKKEQWDKIRYSTKEGSNELQQEVISSFKQYPLKLAWAITVHKAQGQTLENVVLDMGYGAFAHGQTYVALSRCKSLSGLFLKKAIREKDIIVDKRVIEFLNGDQR